MRGYQRIFNTHLMVCFYFHIIYNAAVVIWRIVNPVGIINSQIAILPVWIEWTKNFYCQHISFIIMNSFCYIQIKHSEWTFDLSGISDQRSVQPNIRFIIDAMQFEYNGFILFGGRQTECFPKPPG